MSTGQWLEVVAGLALVLFILFEVFRSAVLPRPATGKFLTVRYVFRVGWSFWRWFGTRSTNAAKREARLAAFGPLSVFLMFGVWAAGLVLGYALLIDGYSAGLHPAPQNFGDSLYFSATTFVPLSYGDVVPLEVPARIVTVAESASGIVLAALVITLLFSLFQSFQSREEKVVALDALAGAPPSGVQILETAAEGHMGDELTATFDVWRAWSASVLESHLAFPVLAYFRSSHDNEAWLNSFGAVMDAAVLVISSIDDPSEGSAHLMLTVGKHLVADFSWYFDLVQSTEPYVERAEFDEALTRLRKAGYRCRDTEQAWVKFSDLRSRYAAPINQLSKRLAIIPAQWIGDRSYLPHVRPLAARPRQESASARS